MNIRPTQGSNFQLVRSGLLANFSKLIRAQEQLSSGKRILRPSDDPVGTSASLALHRQLGDVSRFRAALATGGPQLDASMAALEDAGQLMADARTFVIQGMNGTLSAEDRHSLGRQVEFLKERLLEIANTSFNDRYLFAGTVTDTPPFAETTANGASHVVYRGDSSERRVPVGPGVDVPVLLPGSDAFAKSDASGVTYGSLTGVARGTSADEGSGYGYLVVRHDATTAALGSGLALVGGGAQDTLLGDRTLVVDAAAGTVRLGTGEAVSIPAAGSASAADVLVRDEHGAELHLDFTGFTGADFSGTVSGSGSISLDGVSFTAIDFVDDDLELTDAARGRLVHVDTRGIVRASTELLTFSGTVNAFDILQGISDDLNNIHGLDTQALQERLSARLSEFDRNYDNVQAGLGILGARSQRLTASDARLQDLDLSMRAILTEIEDADLSSVVLDLTKAEQTLQLTQAAGARLLQNSLLNYLR